MARKREELSRILKNILGNNRVYFQSPGPNTLEYPCIIYSFETFQSDAADNIKYRNFKRYSITLIDRKPDNDEIFNKLLDIPYCSHNRRFITENLYHDVFNLYF